MTTTPLTLGDVHAIPDLTDRIRAYTTYIRAGEDKLREARRLRDDDLRALADKVGPTEAARRAGLSLSTVKAARPRP